jgi:hypothetical protein
LLAKYPCLGSADSIEELKKWRDTVESVRLHEIKHHHLQRIRLKDLLFSKFQEVALELRKRDQDLLPFKAAEEKWGFWLKKTEHIINTSTSIDTEAILLSFDAFSKKLLDEFDQSALCNPMHWIERGNALREQTLHKRKGHVFQCSFSSGASAFLKGDKQKLVKALLAYDKAIQLDPLFPCRPTTTDPLPSCCCTREIILKRPCTTLAKPGRSSKRPCSLGCR